MLQCYNRGCGQKFDPNNNNDDSCRHHPGEPFFHDAYKGWSCCKKKSVDFTEFLNTKGCALSKHSNIKPPEPEKSEKCIEYEEESKEIPPIKPIVKEMVRPPFDSPLVEITPSVLPALKESIDALVPKISNKKTENTNEIAVGTNCKNGGCTVTYDSPSTDDTECRYHPGVPIFHEGMKYWSCCQRKTSDFTSFLNQPGCSSGKHKWIKDNDDKTVVDCRYDWHQTPSNVIVAIYGKLYHYERSKIKINPVRLNVCLIFPDQNDAQFNLDLELRGIIKVEGATVKMFPTKVEIVMPKAEPRTWQKLDFPRTTPKPEQSSESQMKLKKLNIKDSSDSESDVDLDDVTPYKSGATIEDVP